MKWGLLIGNRAKRQFGRLSLSERDLINAALTDLSENPFSGDVKFLRGTGGVLRRRVGDWRVIFELYENKHVIAILTIERRGTNTY
jgi:mRNA-degrading endonuclease RelE of RelBE toxin-antitoxin system